MGLYVTDMKFHPRMKRELFTREFHSGMKQGEIHLGKKFGLKENL